MALSEEIINSWKKGRSSSGEPVKTSKWAWLRWFAASTLLYLSGVGVVAMYKNDNPPDVVWGGLVPVAALAGFVIELFLLPYWHAAREDRRARRMIELQALDSLGQERPELAARLVRVHLAQFTRWCDQAERWCAWTGVCGAAAWVVGFVLVVKGVGFFNSNKFAPAAAAEAAGAVVLLTGVVLFGLSGRALGSVGRISRRLVLEKNPELANAPPRAAAVQSVRINAGGPRFVDGEGNVWESDTGFTGGNTVDRGAIPIENSLVAEIYRSERWGMTAFARDLPNGTYTVKLHFAETDPAVTAAGLRVFTVDVQGTVVNNLDVFASAGGARRPHVVTRQVAVNNGTLRVTFTVGAVRHPIINGVEVLSSAV
jgi:hypothetical protein